MAPGRPAQRRTQASRGEHVYKLGEVGRKTGITLPDTGERDEYGMERDDGLFSSPEKQTNSGAAANGWSQSMSDDEQDMEIDDASPDGPLTVSRKRNRLSIPKARSPVKTFLNSPARQNPHLDRRHSSPIQENPDSERVSASQARSKSVKRKLDFAAETQMKPPTNGHSEANAKLTNGRSQHVSSDVEDEEILQGRGKKAQRVRQEEEQQEEEDGEEESIQALDMGDDDDVEPSIEEPDEVETVQQEEEEEEEPLKGDRRGRPKAKATEDTEPAVESPKRQRSKRHSSGGEDVEVPQPKRQKAGRAEKAKNTATASKSAATSTKEPAKTPAVKSKASRKRKSSGVGVDSPVVIPRPPPPKGRGLQILRREKLDDTAVRTTRSGRVSAKPLAFWRGERYEYDEEAEETIEDRNGRQIKVGSKIKEIVRVDAEEEGPKYKRRGKPSKTGGKRRRRTSDEEDADGEERSDWEYDPGRVTGEVMLWYPEHELNPPQGEDQVEVIEEDLAISQAAIQMRDIKDATFQFAKTLTMPFFGSGIVDLPPHSEKKLKNSRKMQMVFFVHYGLVQVTIAQTTFKIGKGGQWFVPRGNYYSIENHSDRPARIFFAQGCELLVPVETEEE